MNIATMISSTFKLQTILDEINKCEVRCANCHARKTALERGYYACLKQKKLRLFSRYLIEHPAGIEPATLGIETQCSVR